jgi:hypothetical protein
MVELFPATAFPDHGGWANELYVVYGPVASYNQWTNRSRPTGEDRAITEADKEFIRKLWPEPECEPLPPRRYYELLSKGRYRRRR